MINTLSWSTVLQQISSQVWGRSRSSVYFSIVPAWQFNKNRRQSFKYFAYFSRCRQLRFSLQRYQKRRCKWHWWVEVTKHLYSAWLIKKPILIQKFSPFYTLCLGISDDIDISTIPIDKTTMIKATIALPIWSWTSSLIVVRWWQRNLPKKCVDTFKVFVCSFSKLVSWMMPGLKIVNLSLRSSLDRV